ncbi:MAG: transglutaminase family protein [Cytophagales bacterium]|nr:MAG: transglutaminase family protein [Cytophagales bacterium]
MSIRVALHHITHYQYDKSISLSPHVFRLRPAVHSRTAIEGYSLKITPENHFINWQQDPFGNFLARVVFPEKTKELKIEVEVIANLVVINPFDFFIEEYAQEYPFKYDEQMKKELLPYLEVSEKGPIFKEWMSTVNQTKQLTIDFLVGLNQLLYKSVNYSIRLEPGIQTCEETLGKAVGSCRDSTWVLVQALRKLGLAARFVSGYLVQLTPDVKALDGPSGPEKDFTDLHAWAEVYIPGAGWIGLDPTSGLVAGEGHIPLACTPDPVSAAPITGGSEKCETIFNFSNEVYRIKEAPRVTSPYSEEDWQTIMALGEKVDADFEEGDVRLTMGGEPTFVSIDDMESAQWNTAADGEDKRKLAGSLIRNLRKEFGPQGLLHFGQGKWYPGELLPRWQLGLYWRKDKKPIWHNDKLIAEDNKDYGFTHMHAERFINILVGYLGLQRKNISAAYEDIFYFLWEEGRVPVNVNPLKANLKSPLERQKLAELLNRGLSTPTGFAIPIRRNFKNNAWESEQWQFKNQHLYLIPGNSPMGLRLPLKSLEEGVEEEIEKRFERDLFDTPEPLENYKDKVHLQRDQARANAVAQNKVDEAFVYIKKTTNPFKKNNNLIRTSICVEPRNGRLYVFLPPIEYAEHYLEIIASIEATAEELSMPVTIEGYTPPRDQRLEHLTVTPDPGVIEVNIHPSTSWKELVEKYQILYDTAFRSRLATEKFMLDGRHTGTGGGNHITIGGAKPSDSPILRKPDLLRSLITYWQHHPSLSYLFASEFVGPTSQAPRVDEGRVENLYELEIAFDQIPENNDVPFWLVDRLFRHLLTDITGNTHRSEFCVDKLYSPDSSSGRLGILEFRAFDMPPHFRMGMVQMLLLRALIGMFWKKPYKQKLVRWGTELHDKYLLPHYVSSDLKEVISDLNEAGYLFEMRWFQPFFAFRFPYIGTTQIENIRIELSKAIEPWHVLGEEMSSGGTARFVDSSLERLQVKIFGLTESRYTLSCNGVAIPLHYTGTNGEYVAGIRFRAWQPPSALHPTIGIDSPLTFDLIDTWSGKSVGGCTYFVSHPGGRNYETFPINSYEAESRRVSRFWDINHSPGLIQPTTEQAELNRKFVEGRPIAPMSLPEEIKHPESPYTMDLRRRWKAK